MIDYNDKEINIANRKRIHLIDKINAYFKQMIDYKNNPLKTKKELIKSFNNQINTALEIFR